MSDNLKDAMGALVSNARNVMQNSDRKAAYDALMAKQQTTICTGNAPDDMVVARVNLQFDVVDVTFAPPFFQCPPDIAAEHVKTALNQALQAVKKESAAQMSDIMKVMGMGQ